VILKTKFLQALAGRKKNCSTNEIEKNTFALLQARKNE